MALEVSPQGEAPFMGQTTELSWTGLGVQGGSRPWAGGMVPGWLMLALEQQLEGKIPTVLLSAV